MDNILDQTKQAYQDKPGADIPVSGSVPTNKTVLELASLGYAKEAREKEVKRTPSKPTLKNVLDLIDQERLPEGLRAIAKSPPSKEDLRYLPKEVQRLVMELSTLDKAIEAIPNVEKNVGLLRSQKDSWTGGAIKAGITDKQASVNGLSYPHHLDIEERALSKINSERDSIVRGARAFAENNPQLVEKANSALEMLARELQSPLSFEEAKAGIPLHKKTARQWLQDVRDKPSLDDRLIAMGVLDDAGIDHKAILTEVDRQGLSLTDRRIEEMRDKQENQNS